MRDSSGGSGRTRPRAGARPVGHTPCARGPGQHRQGPLLPSDQGAPCAQICPATAQVCGKAAACHAGGPRAHVSGRWPAGGQALPRAGKAGRRPQQRDRGLGSEGPTAWTAREGGAQGTIHVVVCTRQPPATYRRGPEPGGAASPPAAICGSPGRPGCTGAQGPGDGHSPQGLTLLRPLYLT